MSKKNWITVASVVTLAIVALAVSAQTRPVLLSVSPDPTELRPRNHCIMNPFRDRSPERASERYLAALRNGHVEVLAEVLPNDARDRIMQSERNWPILSWRIGRRHDTSDASDLMYWVKRGNGYSGPRYYEEEVQFRVARSPGQARVVAFGAIY